MHRPLSRWVARTKDGSVTTLGPVNDGMDRIDARSDPQFAAGWDRIGIPISGSQLALGLAETATDAVVVELDGFGRPLPITPGGLARLIELEEFWPAINRWEPVAEFATEELALRHIILERLGAEAQPPPQVFHLLPWEQVERVVDAVRAELSAHDVGPVIELRHWFTSAVRGLTGPLEQLDHGLRSQNPEVARAGSTALISNLRFLNADRLPDHTRTELIGLVDALVELDPLAGHAAGLARRRLEPGAEAVPASTVEIDSRMVAAAGGASVRELTFRREDEFQQLQFTVTRGGVLRVVVVVLPFDSIAGAGPLGSRRGAFLSLRLRARDGRPPQMYWIALYPARETLVGSVQVPLPPGITAVECDDVPVGADELSLQPPELLLNSIRLSYSREHAAWRAAAEGLDLDHALSQAWRLYDMRQR